MDGSNSSQLVTLGDVISSGMKDQQEFTILCQTVYQWMKAQHLMVIALERVSENISSIRVIYWDSQGTTHIESFVECPLYTAAQPRSTW